jgi:hypothetical protein
MMATWAPDSEGTLGIADVTLGLFAAPKQIVACLRLAHPYSAVPYDKVFLLER